MSTDFNNWLNFDPRTSASLERTDEVDQRARAKLAKQIERNVRTRADPGISRKAGHAAEAMRVKSEGDRFVIHAESHADVLRATSKQVTGDRQEADGVERLFEQSSGVPTIEKGADGSSKAVFNSIGLNKLFQEQKEAEQQHMIKQAVTETLRTGIVNAYQESMSDIDREHPEEK